MAFVSGLMGITGTGAITVVYDEQCELLYAETLPLLVGQTREARPCRERSRHAAPVAGPHPL